MRHDKIVGHVAVMLVGLISGVPVQAVAPPVPEGACANDTAGMCPVWSGPGNPPVPEGNRGNDAKVRDQHPRSWLENWQRLEQQRKQDRKALSTTFQTDSGAADFSSEKGREFTIVVRIEEGSRKRADNVPGRCFSNLGMVIPPAHAVRRGQCKYVGYTYMGYRSSEAMKGRLFPGGGDLAEFLAGCCSTEALEGRPNEEFDAVVETLQHKLMELHEEGFFEVVVHTLGKDRADVNIRYEPVYPPEPEWPGSCGAGFTF